ncbi:hypothetical protein GT755_07330 [Herbidospora sp. NEAU-GS84]|uniref:Uncharacterized protein n=1 Tax=Herbidospora solisilvae TaxID=2696284 RepID=A0A7C9NZA3_9ACTN|nr:hypothetical protein [Herbidospora solisilvae]NAS21497.1 hypothetical protein [Herbidospora solisilvae]
MVNKSPEPFRARVQTLKAAGMSYVDMYLGCERVRSDSWWNSVALHGAWGGPKSARVGPPAPETWEGIAKLFGTSKDDVAAMIAADWYGTGATDVQPEDSRRAGAMTQLSDDDLALLDRIAARLGSTPQPEGRTPMAVLEIKKWSPRNYSEGAESTKRCTWGSGKVSGACPETPVYTVRARDDSRWSACRTHVVTYIDDRLEEH